MKLEGIVKQLANRINQPHVVETYLKKVADTCYKKGLSDAKELEAQSNWIDVTPETMPSYGKEVLIQWRCPTGNNYNYIDKAVLKSKVDGARGTEYVWTFVSMGWPHVAVTLGVDSKKPCEVTHWQEIKPPTE